MFEKYTEKARRVIFYARYEAAQWGSSYIRSEHLLLAILREDKALTNRFFSAHTSVQSIRKQIEQNTPPRQRVETSVDLPLDDESKQILLNAAEESERLSLNYIGTEHLLIGILREEKSFAADILQKQGLKLGAVREEVARLAQEREQSRQSKISTTLTDVSRDLTKAAMDLELNPLIGREQELQWVIEILCSHHNKNAVIVGERGAGKTAIVEGLAQRMADGEVPSFLASKRLLAVDIQLILSGDRQSVEKSLHAFIKALVDTPAVIIFIDELQAIVAKSLVLGSRDVAEFLKPALLSGHIQCIGTCSPDEYKKAIQATPWLGRCFQPVNVAPLSEDETVKVLYIHKEQYEKFHSVTYTDDAIRCAVNCSGRYFPDSSVLAKAAEILDMSGSRVKLRPTMLPDEIMEVQKRIKFIVHQMEKVIANGEFEKARFYSDEERTQREELRKLRDKYRLDDASAGIVSREDVEEVVSRWTGLPIAIVRAQQEPEGNLSPQSVPEKAPNLLVTPGSRRLKVFLCHSSRDKAAVRELYEKLKERNIDPWLDKVSILPGQDWDYEISNAVRASHAVIVCLSAHVVSKAGYLHKEMRKALDVADEQPEGTIYVIPLKLEECDVPNRLRRWQWVDLFDEGGFEKLMQALLQRAEALGIQLN